MQYQQNINPKMLKLNTNLSSSFRRSASRKVASSRYLWRLCLSNSFFCRRCIISSLILDFSLEIIRKQKVVNSQYNADLISELTEIAVALYRPSTSVEKKIKHISTEQQ